MKRSALAATLASFILLLGACGQRGPLFLPDEPKQQTTVPGSKQSPATPTGKEDDEKKKRPAEAAPPPGDAPAAPGEPPPSGTPPREDPNGEAPKPTEPPTSANQSSR